MTIAPMSTPPSPQLAQTALQRVQRLLAGRVRRAGAAPGPADWYFQCEATPPTPYPGGWQVRVRTWRHWSDVAVDFDAESGQRMVRCVDRLAEPATDKRLSPEEAERAVSEHWPIPAGARFAGITHEEFASGIVLTRAEWRHWHDQLRVEGDFLRAWIHPETRALVAVRQKWRPVVGL